MAQIQKGDTFADGQLVTASRLNALVDSALLNSNAITDQTAVSGYDIQDSADYLLVYDGSAAALRKASVGDILNSNNGSPIRTTNINGVSGFGIAVGLSSGQTFTVNGITNLAGASTTIGGNMIVGGTANITGNTVMTGNLSVGGNIVITGSNNIMPTGAVMLFAMASVPTGWAKCNGVAVSRTSGTYSALFAIIGTTYGAGDGVNTFNLPELRGEFVRGWDDGRGVDTSRAIGSTQQQQLEAHKHISSNNDCQTYSAVNGTGTGAYNYWCDSNGIGSGAGASLTGDGTHIEQTAKLGTETRPRNVAMQYCIKL